MGLACVGSFTSPRYLVEYVWDERPHLLAAFSVFFRQSTGVRPWQLWQCGCDGQWQRQVLGGRHGGNSWGSLQEEDQSVKTVEIRISDPIKQERYDFNISKLHPFICSEPSDLISCRNNYCIFCLVSRWVQHPLPDRPWPRLQLASLNTSFMPTVQPLLRLALPACDHLIATCYLNFAS